MSFSIDEFVSTVNKKGIHDPTKYQVIVTSPVGTLTQDGSKYCTAANIASMEFEPTDHFIHGPVRKVAILEQYTSTTSLTFYNDYDYTEFKFFHKWMEYIGKEDFYIRYYDEYKGELILLSYDREAKPRFGVVAAECYPVALSGYKFAYGGDKSVPTFTVTFNIHHTEIH